MTKKKFANSAEPGEIDIHALYSASFEIKNATPQNQPRSELYDRWYCGLTGCLGPGNRLPGMFVSPSRF